MATSFSIKQQFPVSSETLYNAWLSSQEHTKMTGGEAQCTNFENGAFSAWDGYISGKNQILVVNTEINQLWRTTEFLETDADSHLKLRLSDTDNGCELTLTHSNIPEGQPDYEQGWEDHYFTPMREYFG